MMTKQILVHMCCAPCASASGERLMLDGYEVALYFSNSNIYPREEYQKRLAYAHKLANHWQVVIEEDTYDHDTWREKVRGLEHEPEKGARCPVCFNYSLERTAMLADRLNFPTFTTTLTLSPHKVSRMIFELGKAFPKYVPYDFKKKHGFLRSLQLSEELDLYRQSYCGCEFSLAETQQPKRVACNL